MKSNEITRFLPRTAFIVVVLLATLTPTLLNASGSAGGEAYLGVYTQHLGKMLQKETSFKGDGLYVEKVERRSPAARAGIESGDVILKVGNKDISSRRALQRALWKMEPGDEIQITVWRDNRQLKFKATLGSRVDDYKFARDERTRRAKKYRHVRSDYFEDITSDLRYEEIVIPEIVVPEIRHALHVNSEVVVPEVPEILIPPNVFEAQLLVRDLRESSQALREYERFSSSIPEVEEFKALNELNGLRGLAGHMIEFPVPDEAINDRMAED